MSAVLNGQTTETLQTLSNLITNTVLAKGEESFMAYAVEDSEIKGLLTSDISLTSLVNDLSNEAFHNLTEQARDMAFEVLSTGGNHQVISPKVSTSIIRPGYWDDLVMYLTPGASRPAIALVGPAGNGKTTAAEAVCEALGYDYTVIDATEYLEPADLIGGMTYHPEKGEIWKDGPVTKTFREGKAVIINEFDALNPRAALCLQSVCQDPGPARKGRYVTTPGAAEHDRVYPEGDCPLIVTMNTYGTGATRQYVGRNALDAATADRFTIVSTGYENEAAIIRSRGYSALTAHDLENWADTMRQRIEDNALRVILSLRTLLRMAQAVETYGQSFSEAVEKEFMGRLESDVKDLLS